MSSQDAHEIRHLAKNLDAKGKRRQAAQEKATARQWELIELAVKAFAAKYPLQWNTFQLDQQVTKTSGQSYLVAQEGDLKKANYRHTASFPVVVQNGEIIDSLYPVLEKIIPGLTDKRSKNFVEFLRRFPIFSPSDKIGASQ